MSSSLSPGTKLGRYEIRSKIGEGGMGEVYLAQDTQLDRTVALKILSAEIARDQQRLSRFLQEARAASRLKSANVAHIYEIGDIEGLHFISMEYVEGQPLNNKMGGRPMEAAEIVKLGIQITRALEEAHSKGITHRDIKPQNIMVTPVAEAKVLDFGLAKLSAVASQAADQTADSELATKVKTSPGVVMGTVNYMSPEQAMGRDVDHRTDIFSLGVVLYEMATARVPFSGGSLTETIDRIAHAQPEAIARFNYNVPAELDVIIKKALRKNRDERYQSARDLLVDLRDLERELEFAARMEHSVAPSTTGSIPRANSERVTEILTSHEPSLITSETPNAPTHVSSAEYLTREIKLHKKGIGIVLAVFLIAAISLTVGLYKIFIRNQSAQPGTLKVTPLTSSPGTERGVAFSPDGRQVAYVWTGEKKDNFDLYVKLIGAGEPLRLTTNPAREMSPAWSPDGRYIAFLRGAGEGKGFYLIPALGGAERKLADAYEYTGPGVRAQVLDWSPDGKTLAVSDKTSDDEPWSIFLLSVETGDRRRLTQPPTGYTGDQFVSFSPDSSRLAFVRRRAFQGGDIYTVSVAGGEPARITSDEVGVYGLAWTPDGAGLVFSSDRGGGGGGASTLWKVPATGGAPAPAAGVGENVHELSIARQGDRLAYAQMSADFNIYRIELTSQAGGKPGAGAPLSFISSTRIELSPQFSPDGRRVAFMSNRSGSGELWVCDAEGKNPAQLTNSGGPSTDTPNWSPDGRLIAFTSLAVGNADIYVVGADGGSPSRLTTEPSAEITPSWSRDGRWIYFSSNSTGRSEVWKMPATGGAAIQLTRGGGQRPAETPDGRTVYYLKGRNDPGLWQVSAEGGEETRVFEARVDPGNWTTVARGIYFLTRQLPQTQYTLEFFDFATRQTTQITTLDGPRGTFVISGLTVSPDERWVLYTQRDKLDYDLMLVENFR